MITLIAISITLALLAVAALHIVWGLGIWWPVRDEATLVASAVGFNGATRMPGPVPCFFVAAFLVLGAVWPWLPAGWLRVLGLGVAATTLLIRGFLPWRSSWRALTPQQPFARLDKKLYGPACLALGTGFAILFFQAL
ncbi:MAG: DUF3995 domain-containing protein [Rhodobacteraceae bacterium]|nr:DUF3995 domain-containing protein [Paracoccaceae bacterium]